MYPLAKTIKHINLIKLTLCKEACVSTLIREADQNGRKTIHAFLIGKRLQRFVDVFDIQLVDDAHASSPSVPVTSTKMAFFWRMNDSGM